MSEKSKERVENISPEEIEKFKRRNKSGWRIYWHKQKLINSTRYYEEQLRTLGELKTRVAQHRADLDYFEGQIARAEKEGRDGFDQEKYKPLKKGIEK